ncbi:hypothetical protein MCOR27_010489 [Pyricularia oryzae]|uniref:Uncharacterized protein n=1 Tax=Pyricularia grisea TaxID=148305 RepID=A0ABQ8N5W4_PYRGI|nr:hypothetical protein MCOR01_004613 [Pyricularia oryzae]KAI6291804.1 hypothetical protein MCOR33_010325 [Pyricularia grisea]KAH9431304.1 hypothetical protein MCOR02_008602 [Pyricularia oryzae]KAI6254840.1 hypothetical protein MCOR19_008674 [Pyricularia oryzae]KAI6267682.1 hypothetical protein MCOR27_010489 [Pyricularia oryzae]
MSLFSGGFLGGQDTREGSGDGAVSNGLSGLSIAGDRKPAASPTVTSQGVISFDITERFTNAAKALKPGGLVKDGYFTLFESVGALEIMDPKMDSGCLADGESLDPDYDVTRPLLPTEVIGIIDQLLCHEMSWHSGYPLSQTILTSVHITRMMDPTPQTIDEAHFIRRCDFNSSETSNGNDSELDAAMHTVLRAYCLGLLKTCWYVNEQIKSEHYYEEEDFVTNTYNQSLLDNISREEIRDNIQDARSLVRRLQNFLTMDIIEALDYRLELRYAILRAIELTGLRSNPDSIKMPWVELKAVLEQVNSSHYLGQPVPDAFSPKLQRRLASTMPPRPIVELEFLQAYDMWTAFVADGLEIIQVLNYHDSQTLLNFVFWFQAKKPQPIVFIRTLLESYIFKDQIILGTRSIRQLMDDDFSLVVMPCSLLLDPQNDSIEIPHDPRYAISYQMEVFRQRAAQHYLEIFQSLCQNRCRARRNMCHLINELDLVQIDAEEVDQLLRIAAEEHPLKQQTRLDPTDPNSTSNALPLSSWVYLYKLRLMEWIVQLGFELSLYAPDEMGGMYWYLTYLAQKRIHHLERIKKFTLLSMHELRLRHKSSKKGTEDLSDLPPEQEALLTRSLSYLRNAMIDAAVTMELATALHCLYTALYRLELIRPAPPNSFSNDELRYEVRMKPFTGIGLPELPSYELYSRQSTLRHLATTTKVLDMADKAVASARKAYEHVVKFTEKEAFAVGPTHQRWSAGTKSCIKSCIVTGIAIKSLRQTGGSLRAEVPLPDECYNRWWIVPKVSADKPE